MLLTRDEVVDALRSHLDGRHDEAWLVAWADEREGESVTYDPACESAIADVLFVLSTPEINGPVTPDSVRALLARLTT